MKEIIQGFYQKKHFWTRLILVIAAVILMGFALSWLLLVDLGTDPCTLLNQTISTRLNSLFSLLYCKLVQSFFTLKFFASNS